MNHKLRKLLNCFVISNKQAYVIHLVIFINSMFMYVVGKVYSHFWSFEVFFPPWTVSIQYAMMQCTWLRMPSLWCTFSDPVLIKSESAYLVPAVHPISTWRLTLGWTPYFLLFPARHGFASRFVHHLGREFRYSNAHLTTPFSRVAFGTHLPS